MGWDRVLALGESAHELRLYRCCRRSMCANPAKVAHKATCRRSSQFGFGFFSMSLQNPLHRWSSNRALQVKDRSLVSASSKVASTGRR